MLRVLLTVLLPLAAPFLIYFGWIWLVRRKAASGELTIDWRETPWPKRCPTRSASGIRCRGTATQSAGMGWIR